MEVVSRAVHAHAVEAAEYRPQNEADEVHQDGHKDCSDTADMEAVERSVEIGEDHEQMAAGHAAAEGKIGRMEEAAAHDSAAAVGNNHPG